jgi:N-acetyl-gamma-glutamyl-phosphate reductase
MRKKQIGIIGATGYTGSELVRILINHPEVDLALITSESRAGEKFSDVHPFFTGIADHELMPADKVDDYELDLVFLALPHGVSMEFVKRFKDKPFSIVDLSGDFRLDSKEIYEEWYQKEHTFPEGFESVAYGLPELYADDIRQSRLVANPGCFPTGAILGLSPLIKNELAEISSIIVDSKTGVTGAGIKASSVSHFSNVNDNFKAYGLKRHRHSIEIQGILSRLSMNNVTVQFTPHLLPVDRGILSTIYVQPKGNITEDELRTVYEDFYADAPFVRMRKSPPAIKDVRGTNYCDIYPTYDKRTNNIIIISVIDNLVKGAAGLAVQNMNILFGLDESTGLNQIPVNP